MEPEVESSGPMPPSSSDGPRFLLEETSIGLFSETMIPLHRPANSCRDALQILVTRVSLGNPVPRLLGSSERAYGRDSQTFTNTQSFLKFTVHLGAVLGHRVLVSHH